MVAQRIDLLDCSTGLARQLGDAVVDRAAAGGWAGAAPSPTLFVATTVNEYAWPAVRPLTVQVRAPVVAQPALAGVVVTL